MCAHSENKTSKSIVLDFCINKDSSASVTEANTGFHYLILNIVMQFNNTEPCQRRFCTKIF